MKYYFSINMNAQEFLPYYQGKIQNILVTSTRGERVAFPVMHLRKYIGFNGIQGYFCLETQAHKFISLEKLN